jgi:hypothetical protein
MLALDLIRWWYSQGWQEWMRRSEAWLTGIYQGFSVPILAGTLFAPWKRITTYAGKSLPEQLHAFADNLVSRFVGSFVRIIVLFVALIALALGSIVAAIGILVWFALPPLAVALIVIGLL